MDAERDARELLEKADAFMNRLRPPAEDDVPVLTDVVTDPAPRLGAAGPAADAHHAASPRPVAPDALHAAIHAVVAREVDNWLDLNLPDVVLRVLDGLTDQLILHIGDQARKELLPRLQEALDEACAPTTRRD